MPLQRKPQKHAVAGLFLLTHLALGCCRSSCRSIRNKMDTIQAPVRPPELCACSQLQGNTEHLLKFTCMDTPRTLQVHFTSAIAGDEKCSAACE
jgi:hypothetical protein